VLHLFTAQTGVPYRRFRMWKRLMLSFELLHGQDNMTFAAMESGFADATHFSHCFRDTFGVNPAPVFLRIERFERLG
jgi:AraC-like DNA-binding protein